LPVQFLLPRNTLSLIIPAFFRKKIPRQQRGIFYGKEMLMLSQPFAADVNSVVECRQFTNADKLLCRNLNF
jgi:hypothetical protein